MISIYLKNTKIKKKLALLKKIFNKVLPFFFSFSVELPLQDPSWYSMISSNLNEHQKKSLHQILMTAEQKRNQKRSDAIEKSGGKMMKTE